MTLNDTDTNDIVRPELTEKQARALLTYTETALSADDNRDEYNVLLSDACDELSRSLQSD